MQRAAANAGALAAALALAVPVFGQQSPAPAALKVHALKKGSYWVEGGSSNTAFLVGPKGVVILDTQLTVEDANAELTEIGKLTHNPVDAIIVSHSDPGNVGGLPAFPRGIPIIAQENVRSTIQAVNAGTSKDYPAPLLPLYRGLADFPPTRTVGGTETLDIDGFKLVLMHIAPAHTGSDLAVYLPAQKWVFAGDIINTNLGAYPIIHRSGSSLGWIATMHALLALDADTYVPGHGPIESKAWLQSHLQGTEQRREQIKTLFEAHKSLDEIKQALPETLVDPRFPSFAQTVYEELAQGYPRP
jgi:glyoxylase-like metal-dependent hydrolase (beta-lactamase superfamily II)